ncbi:MAG: hypothetical protein ACYDCP_07785 [Thermoplasmataceae archaeon]
MGELDDLSESTQTFALYRCDQCGRVDFYEPELTEEKKHHLL